MLNERDIFFSKEPQKLLSPYSHDQLAAALKYSNFENLDELIDHIYKKYHHVDLISWDPPTFFDYTTQSVISLDQLNYDLDKYSPMALQELGFQLESALQKLGNDFRAYPLQQLYQRISNLIYKIFNIDFIVE